MTQNKMTKPIQHKLTLFDCLKLKSDRVNLTLCEVAVRVKTV